MGVRRGEERGLRDGRKEGELFYPLLSVSPVPAEQKTLNLALLCMRVRTLQKKKISITTHVDSFLAVNNLNSFLFGNSFSFSLAFILQL